MDEHEADLQRPQVPPLEVQRRHVRGDAGRQPGEQAGHPLRVPVGEQGMDGGAGGPEAARQVRDIGPEIVELALRHGRQQRPVGGVAHPVRVAAHEHPFAVGVGGSAAPRRGAGLAVIAGGEKGEHGLDVVIAADGQHEVDALRRPRFEQGDHRRPHRIGDGRQAQGPPALRAPVQVDGRIGDGARVLGAHLELAQFGQVGHQHLEAGPGQGAGEGDQPGVVLALGRDAGHQHHGRQRPVSGKIEVSGARPSVDGVAHGPAHRGGRLLLERARPGAGVDVGQHAGRFPEPRGRTGLCPPGEHRRHNQRQHTGTPGHGRI